MGSVPGIDDGGASGSGFYLREATPDEIGRALGGVAGSGSGPGTGHPWLGMGSVDDTEIHHGSSLDTGLPNGFYNGVHPSLPSSNFSAQEYQVAINWRQRGGGMVPEVWDPLGEEHPVEISVLTAQAHGEAGLMSPVNDINGVHPVPLLDIFGRPFLNIHGKRIMRPSDVRLQDMAAIGAAWGKTGSRLEQLLFLSLFKQRGPYDFQRRNGTVDQRYVDFATIAIGVTAAAMGWPANQILNVEDVYAHLFSNFGDVQMDKDWRFLPKRNVDNTLMGYYLYETGGADWQ